MAERIDRLPEFNKRKHHSERDKFVPTAELIHYEDVLKQFFGKDNVPKKKDRKEEFLEILPDLVQKLQDNPMPDDDEARTLMIPALMYAASDKSTMDEDKKEELREILPDFIKGYGGRITDEIDDDDDYDDDEENS